MFLKLIVEILGLVLMIMQFRFLLVALHVPIQQNKRTGDAGWSSLEARWAHNPEVAGSNPAPATSAIR